MIVSVVLQIWPWYDPAERSEFLPSVWKPLNVETTLEELEHLCLLKDSLLYLYGRVF